MKKNISIFAFILSIIGFCTGCFLVGIVLDIIAIVLGVQALKKEEDKRFATAAIAISIVGIVLTVLFYSLFIIYDKKTVSKTEVTKDAVTQIATETEKKSAEISTGTKATEKTSEKPTEKASEVKAAQVTLAQPSSQTSTTTSANEKKTTYDYNGKSYKIIAVDGGDMSGSRQASVAVDIGYGNRIYWGLTNEYGQLVYVIADNVTLQDSSKETLNKEGRYYNNEADVPGTERKDLDKGHVIADSLGGVSNAYNITPQDSTLNRHGDQAYMEKNIRDAGGCTNFVATITYPDTKTMIPSHYHFEYTLKGSPVVDDFDNKNPEASNGSTTADSAQTQAQAKTGSSSSTIIKSANSNATSSSGTSASTKSSSSSASSSSGTGASGSTEDEKSKLAQVDKNGDGKVTIAEAKAAGYSMPIYSSSWLYRYMDDRDHDGEVGE